jgi:uncharacterized protein
LLHLFRLHGDNLAFDIESQALHVLDDCAYALLEAWPQNGQPDDAQLNALRHRFGDAVTDCQAEILQLIAEGQLFAESEPVSLSQLYPDEQRIKSLCLHLCHDCNLRCRYCFAGTGDFGTGQRSMLSLETGRQAVDFLIEASGGRHNLDIDFFGGEPLLNWPVVVGLTEYIEKRAVESGKAIRLTLTTNATLLDAGKTEFINAHFKNCVLSIDGRPHVHDRMRPDAGGRGTYARVVRHIRSFVAARGDREYYLRATFTRHNLDFAADVLHLAELGDAVSVEPVVAPAGCGYEIRAEDVPAIEQAYEDLALALAERARQGHPIHFFHFSIDLDGGPCAYKRLKGCGVGLEYCAVTPDGEIYPCHQFVGQKAFCMGSVKAQPVRLDEAVQAQFRRLLTLDKQACQTCWSRYFCGGGCAANAWQASGSVNGLYDIGCRLQKKRLACALWLKSRAAIAE